MYFFILQHCHLLRTAGVYKELYLSTAFCFLVALIMWHHGRSLEFLKLLSATSHPLWKQLNHDINKLRWVIFGLPKLKYVMKSVVSSESGEQPIL